MRLLPILAILIASFQCAILASAAQPTLTLADEQEILKKYPKSDVLMPLKQVSEHVYYVHGIAGTATENEGFISDSGFVVTKEGVVVFDALGSPSLAVRLYENIRTVTDLPIKKVFVSHYHADHIYGLQVFKELGAEVYAPAGADTYLISPQAETRLKERRVSLKPWVNEDTYVVKPDVYLEKDTKFSLGGFDFEINLLGEAHSDGDLTMYVVNERVLFSGDIIFEGRVPFVGDANTKNWLETLQKLEVSKVVALIPGHGPAATNPNEAISATRSYLEVLRSNMSAAVDDLVPFSEAYAAIDWSKFSSLPAFKAANRRNAYQVYLSIEAEQIN